MMHTLTITMGEDVILTGDTAEMMKRILTEFLRSNLKFVLMVGDWSVLPLVL